MGLMEYFGSLDPIKLLGNLPGGIGQGLIWGIMALGVYITFRLLDFADLSVDGTFATGGAVTVMLLLAGVPAPLAVLIAVAAGIVAGCVTGLLHTLLGIPAILSGILVQFMLYSINLRIMGMASNKAISVDKYDLILSSRYVSSAILIGAIFVLVLIAVMYWYFGTEQGSAIRATGTNPAMAKAQGINIGVMKVIGLALSNGLVALAGGLMAQYQGFADVSMGARRHCDWTGCGYHWRGAVRRYLQKTEKLCHPSAVCGHRRRGLLYGRGRGALDEAQLQRISSCLPL